MIPARSSGSWDKLLRMGETISEKESPAKTRARVYVELAIAATGLLVAITAYIKPETSSRKTYDVLARQLEKQSEDIAKTHDDIVGLRNFMDGYIRAQAERGTTVKVEPVPSASAAAPVLPAPATSATKVVKVVALEPPPSPPALNERPGTFAPPAYARVTGKEDLR